MFEPIPELSSDLEWMLQSGQASRAMLAEVLVEEFSKPVYRLALSLFGEPEAALNAARDAFSAALLNQYRYRSSSSVRAWFYAQALPALLQAQRQAVTAPGPESPPGPGEAALWQALDGLPEAARLPLLLLTIAGLNEAEISAVLKTGEKSLRARLQSAGERLSGAAGAFLAGDPQARLAVSLLARWPAPDFSKEEEARLAAGAERQAGARRARIQRFSSLNELALVGVAMAVVAAVIWGISVLLPDPDASEALQTPTRRPAEIAERRGPPSASSRRFSGRGSASRDAGARPNRRPSPTATPEGAFYFVKPGDTLASIAGDIGVALEALRDFNRIPPGGDVQAGQALVIPGQPVFPDPPRATPVRPVPQPTPLPPSTDPDLILELMGKPHNTWNTIWFDALSLSYGPAGYIGPARTQRFQVWLSRDQMLLISGQQGAASPELALLHSRDGDFIAWPQDGQPWFILMDRAPQGLEPFMDSVNMLLGSPQDWRVGNPDNTFKVAGDDSQAGRDALVLEQRSSQGEVTGRLWLDASTGFPLRVQTLGPPPLSGPGAVNRVDRVVGTEVVVRSVAYDVDLPQGLLDPRVPWRGGFAEDYTGRPAQASLPLPGPQAAEGSMVTGAPPAAGNAVPSTGRERRLAQPAPNGYDPSDMALTFQFPASFDTQSSEDQLRVNLFAGSYLIGSTRMGNPWTMICSRSPDGSRLAYVSVPDLAAPGEDAHSLLHWFALGELDRPQNTLPSINVTHFAFSPDSQRLALFGSGGRKSGGRLYVMDLQTGRPTRLLDLMDAKSFVWSPDGQFLALIGRSNDPQFNESVMVVRMADGKVTYTRSIDFESGNGSSDWPTLDWGVEFPVEMGTLENCAAPPPASPPVE